MKKSLFRASASGIVSARAGLIALLLAATLTACGGGSSSTSPSAATDASSQIANDESGANAPVDPASSTNPASAPEPASAQEAASEVVPPAKKEPTITAAFFSLDSPSKNWSAAAWNTTINDAKKAGFTSITLISSVTRNKDGTTSAYYPSTVPGTMTGASKDVLSTLMPILKKYDMHIRFGLFLDVIEGNQWYSSCTPAADDAKLTKAIADDLWRQYQDYAQLIDGWYLSNEVNTNCMYGNRRVTLGNYYGDVVNYLHTHNNNMSVMISPYFNVNTAAKPEDWTSFWAYIFSAAPIDIIALQDGAGDNSKNPDYQSQLDGLTTWFAATRAGILKSSHPTTELWDNLDLYNTYTGGGAIALDQLTKNAAATKGIVSRYTNFGWFSRFASWSTGTDRLIAPFETWNFAGQ
jgi:hypothetical protein